MPGVESMSNSFAVSTCAVLVITPVSFTVAVIVSEVVPPTAKLPIVQRPVPGTYAPPPWLT